MTDLEADDSDSGRLKCGQCEEWKWPDDHFTDNDGNYMGICLKCVEKYGYQS